MLVHEIALLVAVAAPVVFIAAIDIYLALRGETGTLLLPRILRYPAVQLDPEPQPNASIASVEDESGEPLRKAA